MGKLHKIRRAFAKLPAEERAQMTEDVRRFTTYPTWGAYVYTGKEKRRHDAAKHRYPWDQKRGDVRFQRHDDRHHQFIRKLIADNATG